MKKRAIYNKLTHLVLTILLAIFITSCATKYSAVKHRFNLIMLDEVPVGEQVKKQKETLSFVQQSSFFDLSLNETSIMRKLTHIAEQDNIYFKGYFESFYFPFVYRSVSFKGKAIELKPISVSIN